MRLVSLCKFLIVCLAAMVGVQHHSLQQWSLLHDFNWAVQATVCAGLHACHGSVWRPLLHRGWAGVTSNVVEQSR